MFTISHITWTVLDIDTSFEFYVDLLGFKPIMKSDKSAYFQVGDIWIAIVLGEKRADNRYDHIAFSVTPETFSLHVERLMHAGVIEWQKNGTEGDSFYFLDPSGNKMELHVGDLQSRITIGKRTWGQDVQWFC